MPDYRQSASSIYWVDAGVDTFYCAGDSTIKGVRIGTDSLTGVTYEWQPAPGIDSLDRLSQLIKPPQSRWYYLTITDTTIQGSCQSRTDSVYVEVRVCTGVENEYESESGVKVYPSPANNQLTIEAPTGSELLLYDILGRQAIKQTLQAPKSVIDISALPEGLYIYRVGSHSGKVQILR